MPLVTLYRTVHCPSCDQAAYYLQRLLAARSDAAIWQLREVDIAGRADLWPLYGHCVPVVVVAGQVVLVNPYSLDVTYLRRALEGGHSGTPCGARSGE